MEGSALHPWTDARGVHHFDSDEVEQVARADNQHGSCRDKLPTSLAQADEVDAPRISQRFEHELSIAAEALRMASRRAADLESKNEELRTTAIEALELVQVALGSGTPIEVRQCLYDLRRNR